MAFFEPEVSEDEIYRRRAVFDGEGVGDERQLNNLLKNALKWVMTKEETNDEVVHNHDRLKAAIDQCVQGMARSALMQKVKREEAEHYNHLCKDMEAKIAEAEQDIERNREKKSLLEEQILKQRQACNKLVAAIKDQNDRKTTMAQMEELKKEIHILQRQKLELAVALGRRSQLCHFIKSNAIEVRNIIKAQDEADGYISEEGHATAIMAMDTI